MTIADDIRAGCAEAVTALSESWTWAATKDGTYAAINIVATGLNSQYEPSEMEDTAYTARQVRVACPAGTTDADIPALRQFIKSPDDVVWIVTGINSDAVGSRLYTIERASVATIGDQRGLVR